MKISLAKNENLLALALRKIPGKTDERRARLKSRGKKKTLPCSFAQLFPVPYSVRCTVAYDVLMRAPERNWHARAHLPAHPNGLGSAQPPAADRCCGGGDGGGGCGGVPPPVGWGATRVRVCLTACGRWERIIYCRVQTYGVSPWRQRLRKRLCVCVCA